MDNESTWSFHAGNDLVEVIGALPGRRSGYFPRSRSHGSAMLDLVSGDAEKAPRHSSPPIPRRRRRLKRLPPGYRSIAELAALTQRARSGLYADVARGRLRVCRWRGQLVVAEADFTEWFTPVPLGPAPSGNAGAVAMAEAANE
jgi:hypothetical protein